MATPFVLLVLLGLGLIFRHIAARRSGRLPPGPRPLPIVGNLLGLPTLKPWLTYARWSNTYGSDIIYLELPAGRPIVILNSFEDANELLEKRSRNTSDRVPSTTEQAIHWNFSMSLLPYSLKWRNLRRTFMQYFNQNAVKKYDSVQNREIRAFLKRAANFSENINIASVSQTFASIIMDIVYGRRVTDPKDEYIHISRYSIEGFSAGKLLGSFWVDYFPWMTKIHDWLPQSSWRQFVQFYRPYVDAARDQAFDVVIEDMRRGGDPKPSMTKTLMENLWNKSVDPEQPSEEEETIRDATGIAYTAAADTQVSSITSFLLAMAMFPDVQRKAQAQLGSILGREQLPTSSDIPNLPYIQAIALEMMRWMPVLPIGLPHRTIEPEEYKGYVIPAGCDIFPNQWAMLHDPTYYPDPEAFNPDRFLRDEKIDPNVLDPTRMAFGFGRRMCAGRHLAMNTLVVMIAAILHVYNIEPNTSEPIVPDATTGLLSFPEQLPCRFKPRDEEALKLILSELDE